MCKNSRNQDIKGFCYKRKEIKLSQYADDTQILLDGSEILVRNTVNLLNNFTKISGLKVNYNKSELAPLGRSRMEHQNQNIFLEKIITPPSPFQVKWSFPKVVLSWIW
jgi:hypothetical protein